jgi:hypothetical protein
MASFDYETECPQCGATVPLSAGDDAGLGVCPVCRARFRVVAEVESETDGTAAAPGSPAAGVFELSLSEADQMAPALVCLANEQKVNPLAVGALLEQFLGLEQREARRHVVMSNGLLADGISLDTARRLGDALAAQGIDAFVLPVDRLPASGGEVRIVRVHGADEQALAVEVDLQGSIKTVSWPKLAAGMCVKARFGAEVKYEPQQGAGRMHFVGVGHVGMVGYADQPTTYKRKTVEPEIEVALALRDASGRAYTVGFRESQVRFSYLGDRVQPGRGPNLATLLGDIMRWAPHAFFPAGFRAVAAGKRGRVTKLVGKVERDNYVRWAIACAAARGLFSAA